MLVIMADIRMSMKARWHDEMQHSVRELGCLVVSSPFLCINVMQTL